MRRRLAVLTAVLVLVPAVALAAAEITRKSRITTQGLGPIKVGMTVAQAEKAGGIDLVREGGDARCSYVRPEDRTIRASFMLKGRIIVRVDSFRRGFATVNGVRVGDSEAKVRRRFAGRLRITRHEYIRSGWYLEFVPRERAKRNRRIIFETDGMKVKYIRAGRLPEVRYIEGCA
jgi:hypothetical protein